MAKISIYLDDCRLKQIDQLVKTNPNLTNPSRSALISYLIDQEIIRQTRLNMVEAAKLIDELGLGWTEEEEECAITDVETLHAKVLILKDTPSDKDTAPHIKSF